MRKPKYRRHSVRNIAFVVHEKKRIYLPGKYKSAESQKAYKLFLAEHYRAIADRGPGESPADLATFTITDLMLAFLDFAKTYYPDERNSEYHNIRCAAKLLINFAGGESVATYTASKFKLWQKHLVESGKLRTGINSVMSKMRRAFRWGLTEGLVPESVYGSICAVTPLKAGRSAAKESHEKQPVSRADFEAVKAEVKQRIKDMLELQWLTGVRPGSLLDAKPSQFFPDESSPGDVLWKPKHKTQYRGQILVIPLGPRAKEIYLCYAAMCKTPEEYLFDPRRHTNDKRFREKYSIYSYADAIDRAVKRINKRREKADEPLMAHWSPHQVRHARGHEVRNKYGIEAVQAILGHESLKSTEIYSARRLELAKLVAKETG